jgi:hypothetical protein
MHSYPVRPVEPARSAPALLVAGVVLLCLLVGAGVVVAAGRPERPEGPGSTASVHPTAERSLVAPRDEVRAAQVLRSWDRRRAAAWAGGRPADLVPLYTAGSPAGSRDHRMLATWQRRGMAVEGLGTQVLRLRVLAHRPGRFDVVVVDRVVAGTAVGQGVRRPLPRDSPTTRRVVLVHGTAGWQVASVTPG